MVAGLLLGSAAPGLNDALDAVSVGDVSLPIALGLLLMMYPVLAKVRYGELDRVTGDRRMLVSSLVLNWLVGPALMFTLAWMFLADLPEYRTGLIIVGLARCIAMVLIWNDLACGDREAAAVLVAINSVFQIFAFSAAGLVLPRAAAGVARPRRRGGARRLGGDIAISVLVFLGIPLVLGYLTRRIGEARRGREWYEERFLPRIGPWALYGLLFTIVVLFALQGETILAEPWDVLRIALPLLVYFALMWVGSFALGWRIGLPYTADDDAGLHRCRQQLRARDRGLHRDVRRGLRRGAGRNRRPADRGAGPGRPGLRLALGPAAVLPGPADR